MDLANYVVCVMCPNNHETSQSAASSELAVNMFSDNYYYIAKSRQLCTLSVLLIVVSRSVIHHCVLYVAANSVC